MRAAKAPFCFSCDTPVFNCDAAGGGGFRVHRAWQAQSDRLDTTALLILLGRLSNGARGVWSVVHAPSLDDGDRRPLRRELVCLTRERTQVVNRIKVRLALYSDVIDTSRGLRVMSPAFPGCRFRNRR